MTIRSTGDHGQSGEICWRVVDGPSARVAVCAVHEIAGNGLELRVGYVDHIFRSERFADVTSARARAEEWLTRIRVTGTVNL